MSISRDVLNTFGRLRKDFIMGVFTIVYETEIVPKLKEAMADAIRTEVASTCVDLIQKSAQENMYNKYTPSGAHPYERRYSYLDDNNYQITIGGEWGNELTISEHIKGQGFAENLTEAIESGDKYEWVWSNIFIKQPFPRPFFNVAIEEGISDGTIEKALENGLRRQGF